jgi:hypothetical protein
LISRLARSVRRLQSARRFFDYEGRKSLDDFVCKSVDAPQASSSAVSVKTKTPYKITWSLVETAASYVIEESQYEDFSSALTRETTGTEAEYVREVETDADFYYRVKALSECGESHGRIPF